MDTISDQEILDLLFPELETKDLLRLCQTDRRFYSLCQNESFWEQRVKSEYPELVGQKALSELWRDFYIYLFTSWEVVINNIIDLEDLRNIESEIIKISPGTFLSVIEDLKKRLKRGRVPKPNWRKCIFCLDQGFSPIMVFDIDDPIGINFGRPITEIRRIFFLMYPLTHDLRNITEQRIYSFAPPGLISLPDGQYYYTRSAISGSEEFLDTFKLKVLEEIMYALDLPNTRLSRQEMINRIIEYYADKHLIYYLDTLPDWINNRRLSF